MKFSIGEVRSELYRYKNKEGYIVYHVVESLSRKNGGRGAKMSLVRQNWLQTKIL